MELLVLLSSLVCGSVALSMLIPHHRPFNVEESAVSLGGAPVGLYSRTPNYIGGYDVSAVSLGGAPVGLYEKSRAEALPFFRPFPHYGLPLVPYPYPGVRRPRPFYPVYRPHTRPGPGIIPRGGTVATATATSNTAPGGGLLNFQNIANPVMSLLPPGILGGLLPGGGGGLLPGGGLGGLLPGGGIGGLLPGGGIGGLLPGGLLPGGGIGGLLPGIL